MSLSLLRGYCQYSTRVELSNLYFATRVSAVGVLSVASMDNRKRSLELGWQGEASRVRVSSICRRCYRSLLHLRRQWMPGYQP